MSTRTVSGSFSLADLRSEISGRVLGPDEDGYEAARGLFFGGFDLHPAVIIRPVNDGDVARSIRLARDSGLPLAVRSGGHSSTGHSSVQGGIVLDLRDLRSFEIDVKSRTAWVDSGLTAGEFTAAAAELGLAVGFGDTGSVGIGGLTVGGGIGYLSRKHGLTVDNLLAADVVTADGEVRRVDAETHPDLFWAIRGGGGNFGVVTRFRFQLHELGQVLGGMLFLPATVETIAGFTAAAEAAPDDLSTIANVMNCPPMPFVPAEHHGKIVIMAMVCWAGDPDTGRPVVESLRSGAEPLVDMVDVIPYPRMYPPADPDLHPTSIVRTMFVDSIGPDEAALILERLRASDAPLRAVQLRPLGGAISRVPAETTPYAHRASRVMVNVASFYTGPDDRPGREAWVQDLSSALQQGDGGAYVNFLADEGPERIRAAYPGQTWDRLSAIKGTYDPENLFRRNQNITPPAE